VIQKTVRARVLKDHRVLQRLGEESSLEEQAN
jgi:hypothetical protein